MTSQPNDLMPRPKKRMKKRTITLLSIVAVIAVLILCVLIAVIALYFSGKHSLTHDKEITVVVPSGVEHEDNGATVYFNGQKYIYNKDVMTFLVLGTDKRSFDEESGIGLNGQADAIFLVALDSSSAKVDVISISRESMVDVDTYSQDGEYARTDRMQLCLAYAYGDGGATSCENVSRSVSRLMYGVPIDSYLAIDLDAIPVLTDAVGGVDVPEYDSDLQEQTGRTITLYGADAGRYVQDRNQEFVNANDARIERQSAYIRSFAAKLLQRTKENISVPLTVYNSLDGYMVTDITAGEVAYLAASCASGMRDMVIRRVPGEVVQGERYAEFEVDTDALYSLILDVFYTKA